MTSREMEHRLEEAYPGCQVAVIDLTGGQDHYEVRLSAKELDGLTRVQQHQAIMKVFDEELRSGEIHALAVKTLAAR